MKLDKINFFAGLQGANSIQKQQSIQPAQAVKAGANPFADKNSQNGFGEGLVNSDLSNMSYRLPNGEISNCNTRYIA